MLQPVLDALATPTGGTALDCTAGRGGHAEGIATALGSKGTLILCDLDPGNLEYAAQRAQKAGFCESAYPCPIALISRINL